MKNNSIRFFTFLKSCFNTAWSKSSQMRTPNFLRYYARNSKNHCRKWNGSGRYLLSAQCNGASLERLDTLPVSCLPSTKLERRSLALEEVIFSHFLYLTATSPIVFTNFCFLNKGPCDSRKSKTLQTVKYQEFTSICVLLFWIHIFLHISRKSKIENLVVALGFSSV